MVTRAASSRSLYDQVRPLPGQATLFEIMFDHNLSLFLQREGYRPLKYLKIPSSSPEEGLQTT